MIYLDNAATTEPKFHRSGMGCNEYWFNSNTPYAKTEDEALVYAEDKIKGLLHVTGGHILYFRCATEAIEWLYHKMQLIELFCSPYEHDSVFNLADEVVADNQLSLIKQNSRILYCHQLVNQITGDIWNIYDCIHSLRSAQIYPRHFFGVDLTAAIGHTILPNDLDKYCDALWFSGHKFYTEKNIGGMWISDRLGEYLGASKDPRNQYNLVHGTVDVAGVLMMADAMNFVQHYLYFNHFDDLLTDLCAHFTANNIDASIVALNTKTKTPAINAIYLPNINADALQTYLASKDIYIGVAHSACAGTEDYRVLEAMGFNKKMASQTIRVSFGVDSRYDDIKGLVNEIDNFRRLF